MRKRRKGLSITDFDICIGWGIYSPVSEWIFSVTGSPSLSEISRLRKRGLLGSMRGRITILGLFIEFQLGAVGKSK